MVSIRPSEHKQIKTKTVYGETVSYKDLHVVSCGLCCTSHGNLWFDPKGTGWILRCASCEGLMVEISGMSKKKKTNWILQLMQDAPKAQEPVVNRLFIPSQGQKESDRAKVAAIQAIEASNSASK